MSDDDYGVTFGPGEQMMVEVSPGKFEKCITIDGVSRLLIECPVTCDLPRFVAWAAAAKRFLIDDAKDNVTPEQIKRFEEAVTLVISDKSIEGR